jgi:hypothetical protein
MPGLAEAGRTWATCFVRRLNTDMGFTQSIADPRVSHRVDADSLFLLGTHVDDARVWFSSLAALRGLHDAWSARFGAPGGELGAPVEQPAGALNRAAAPGNASGIPTKTLTGQSFERHRAILLGLAYLSEATRATHPMDLLPTIPPHPGHIA